jgi:hypothetical protein
MVPAHREQGGRVELVQAMPCETFEISTQSTPEIGTGSSIGSDNACYR